MKVGEDPALKQVARSDAFAAVRKEVARRFPQAFRGGGSRIQTGLAGLDAVLGGGLLPGSFGEWVAAAPSSGGTSMIGTLIDTARRWGRLIALVDGADAFDPRMAWEPNRRAEGFLWVRSGDAPKTIRAADLLLRDPHFGVVVMDLRGLPERVVRRSVRPAQWYRLQRLAGARGVILILLAARPLAQGVHYRLYLRQSHRMEDFETPREHLLERIAFRVAGESVGVEELTETASMEEGRFLAREMV
ncbi:MAG: hypothetical protein ACFCU4_06525 [Puniceicoccaceae bacterium]